MPLSSLEPYYLVTPHLGGDLVRLYDAGCVQSQYTIQNDNCTCMSFMKTGQCKHVRMIKGDYSWFTSGQSGAYASSRALEVLEKLDIDLYFKYKEYIKSYPPPEVVTALSFPGLVLGPLSSRLNLGGDKGELYSLQSENDCNFIIKLGVEQNGKEKILRKGSEK